MNSNSALGKKMLNKMLQQITQFKQLMHLQIIAKKSKLNNQKKRMLNINNISKSCNIQSSSQQPKRPQTARSSQISMQKLLKSYKIKGETQLRNPFTKIHVRRPKSALCRVDEHTQLSKSKQKQNGRYEQIKLYYENKYLQNQEKVCSFDCKCGCKREVDIEAIERNQKVGVGRRLQYFRRRP